MLLNELGKINDILYVRWFATFPTERGIKVKRSHGHALQMTHPIAKLPYLHFPSSWRFRTAALLTPIYDTWDKWTNKWHNRPVESALIENENPNRFLMNQVKHIVQPEAGHVEVVMFYHASSDISNS